MRIKGKKILVVSKADGKSCTCFVGNERAKWEVNEYDEDFDYEVLADNVTFCVDEYDIKMALELFSDDVTTEFVLWVRKWAKQILDEI